MWGKLAGTVYKAYVVKMWLSNIFPNKAADWLQLTGTFCSGWQEVTLVAGFGYGGEQEAPLMVPLWKPSKNLNN